MIVSYGYRDAEDGTIEPTETFAIACAMRGAGDDVWLNVDGDWLRALPDAFNRVVVVDNQTLRSAVLIGHELVEAEGNFPFGSDAPTLTMDFNRSTIEWTNGDGTKILYDGRKGV